MNEPSAGAEPAQTLDRRKFAELFDWLCGGARPSANAQTIIATLCDRLIACGVPVSRFALFVFTLNPLVRGRRFIWQPGEGVAVSEAPHSIAQTPEFKSTAAYVVMTTGEGMRRRLDRDNRPLDALDIEQLRTDGMVDYLIEPLVYTTGETHAASWATSDPNGFSDDAIDALRRLALPLARLTETYILRLNAARVLSAYVGRGAGERILAGHIQRGDVETIEAVVAFADVKNFTRLSNTADIEVVISLLNRFYDAMVPAVEDGGGEVLKFLGDGFLAIFPSNLGPDGAMAALGAFADGQSRLDEANADRPAGEPEIGYRVSFHIGSVLFGNVGAQHRLDFTAMGPAVNLGARLLGAAGEVERDWVCSAAFAALSPWPRQSLEPIELKGFEDRQPIYALEVPKSARS